MLGLSPIRELLCNHKFERFLGAKQSEIVGKTDYDFVDKDLADFFREKDNVAMAAGKPCINEEEITYADDGHRELLETIKTPMFRSDGSLIGVLGIARDITERKEMEAHLGQVQKMEAIGTLAVGIAHDFNNILGVIYGYTELANDNAPPDSDYAKDLEQVLIAANRAKDLVRQILAFSRQSTAERIPLRLQPLVKEVLKMLRSSIPTTIEIQDAIDPECGVVLADPTQVHQMVMNLCTNANQVMEETGGILKIELKKVFFEKGCKPLATDLASGEYVELVVSDNGPGIGPGIIDKIFDPFFTTKEKDKGTGMGLSITHGIIASYGGAIAVESELGKGSVFHVYFPVSKQQVVSENKNNIEALRGKEKVLFVDDEEILVQMGKVMLEQLGYTVTVRCSSVEALITFENNPEEFDIIITDQTMPEMTGAELATRMLQIRPDVPIILCTGYSTLIDEASAKTLGIREFVLKPLEKTSLANLIRKVLDA